MFKAKFFPMFPEGEGAGGGGTLLTNQNNEGNQSPSKDESAPPAQNNPPKEQAWYESLPEELKSEASIKNFKDVQSLAKSYLNAQKMIGAEKISIPGKHATEEDWQNVFKKLGLPESVDKYDVKFSDGVTIQEDFIKGFKEAALKAGVLPKQAQALASWFSDINKQSEETVAAEIKKNYETQVNNLKKEWGEAFNRNLSRAHGVLNKFADKELIEYLETTGLGNDTRLVKLFASIGESFKEDSVINPGEFSAAMTPKEALSEANKIMGDMGHPYNRADHPNHKKAVEEVQALFKLAYKS